MKYTSHAQNRIQQRCIPPLVIDWLLSYGKREKSFGSSRITFDKKARRDLSKDVGGQVVKQLSKYLNACIVVNHDRDELITAMWLH